MVTLIEKALRPYFSLGIINIRGCKLHDEALFDEALFDEALFHMTR